LAPFWLPKWSQKPPRSAQQRRHVKKTHFCCHTRKTNEFSSFWEVGASILETKAAQEPSKNEAGFQDRFLVDFCRLLHNLGSILGGKIEAKATKSPSKIEAVLGRRKKLFFKNRAALF
jgi:hypothetical protein